MDFYSKCIRLKDLYLTMNTNPDALVEVSILKQFMLIAFDNNDTLPVSKEFMLKLNLIGYDVKNKELSKKYVSKVLKDLEYNKFILNVEEAIVGYSLEYSSFKEYTLLKVYIIS